MKLSALNDWLSLFANIGVLIGIFVVVVELQQTQTAMDAQASSIRAQMATNLEELALTVRNYETREKIINGQELNPEERRRALTHLNSLLRHFENMHYQYQIGVLGEEIWQANLGGLGDICKDPIFQYLRPNWGQVDGPQGFRASFAELVAAPCNQ